MEILNNIWQALSTENEMLISILSIPLTSIEIYLMMEIFLSALNIPSDKRHRLIFFCIFYVVSITSYYFIPAPYYTLVDYIAMFILILKIFELSIFKTILATLSSFLIYSLIGGLVLNPFITILGITYEEASIIPLYRLTYIFIVYLLVFIVIKLLKYKHFSIKILENLTKLDSKILFTNIIFAFLTLCIQLIITFYYINTYSLIFTFLNFISLFAYFFVSFSSLNKTMNLQVKTTQLENAESYNKTLSNLYDNVRGFKHDFNNMIDLIGGYIDRNDMEGLKKYYNGLRKDCVRVNNSELLNPNIINNSGIYNLIVCKQIKATQLKVNISLEVFFDFNHLHMPIYEFSRILGILLDNAIEAASECEVKQVNLMFRESRANNTQIISIENTYLNKGIDTKLIFEKGISSKQNHSGIGLWKIKQIIQKNNNIVLHTSVDEKYFKQQLEIYY